MDKSTPGTHLIAAAAGGDLVTVKALIPVSDRRPDIAEALRRAAQYGHLECVKALIPVGDPKADNSEALRLAARGGHLDCVEALVPASDPKANRSQALVSAAENGYVDCFKALLPVSDLAAAGSAALSAAAYSGCLECIDILLQTDNSMAGSSKSDNSEPLFWAAKNGHADCIRTLLQVGDPDAALASLMKVSDHDGCDVLLSCLSPEKVEAFIQKHRDMQLPLARGVLASAYAAPMAEPPRRSSTRRHA